MDQIQILGADDSAKMAANPAGGDRLRIIGRYFSVPSQDNFLERVVFGLSRTALIGCFLLSDTMIDCPLVPPGVGLDMPVSVVIAGQSSPDSIRAKFSYEAPSILSAQPSMELYTNGGDSVELTGRGLGFSVDTTFVVVQGVEVAVDGLRSDGSWLKFTMPPGTGIANVAVRIRYSREDENSIAAEVVMESSNSIKLHYAQPMIIGINAEKLGSRYTLTVVGRNFGPNPILRQCAAVTCEPSADTGLEVRNCEVVEDPLEELIRCTAVEEKTVTLFVVTPAVPAPLVSAGTMFVADAPTVRAKQETSQETTLMEFNTDGTSVLELEGTRWTADATLVHINTSPCLMHEGYPQLLDATTDQWALKCTVPEGNGRGYVFISRNGVSSAPIPFTYKKPEILKVSPTTIPTIGGLVTIEGSNFGPQSYSTGMPRLTESRVSMGGLDIQVETWSHSRITVLVNPGTGTNRSVSIITGDYSAVSDYRISFFEPRVHTVYLQDASSPKSPEGRYALVVQGQNFGPQTSSVAFVLPNGDKLRATTRSWTDDEIVLLVPPGQGKAFILVSRGSGTDYQSNVAQSGDASSQFQYDPPQWHTESTTLDGVDTEVTDSGNRGFLVRNSSGGARMTIRGAGFGPISGGTGRSDSVQLLLAHSNGAQLVINATESNHESASFELPAGIGSGYIARMQVNGNPSSETIPVRFDRPYIHEIEDLDSIPLSGSWSLASSNTCIKTDSTPCVLTLRGKNFGQPSLSEQLGFDFTRVYLARSGSNGRELSSSEQRTECASNVVEGPPGTFTRTSAPAYTSSLIHCIVPPASAGAYGSGIQVQVDVAGQPSTESKRISFAPPRITSVSPSVPDANGGEISIFGENLDTQDYHPALKIFVGGDECVGAAVADLPQTSGSTTRAPKYLRCTAPQQVVGPTHLRVQIAGYDIRFPENEADILLSLTCTSGFYGLLNEVCLPCPVGAKCDGDDATPVALAGYFDVQPSRSDKLCPPKRREESTNGTCHLMLPCEPSDACVGANVCSMGYTGERCSSCVSGEYYRRGGECVQCPNNTLILISAFIVGSVLACALGYALTKYKINLAFMTIGIDYFQVLAMFARTRVAWPGILKDLFHILSAFNFNLEISAPECAIPELAYTTKWAAIMSLPMAAFTVLTIVHIVSAAATYFRGRAVSKSEFGASYVGTLMMMMYYLYLYLTRTILDVFNCSPTEPSDGREYLEVVFEDCAKPGGVHLTLLPWAIVGLLVYAIGYPLVVGIVLARYKHTVLEDQILRASGLGDKASTNPNAFAFRQMFHKLYYQFRPTHWFWILVILGRKALIAFTGLMFRKNPAFQLAMALLVMFTAYAAQVRFKPYMSPKDYSAEVETHRAMVAAGHPLRTAINANLDRLTVYHNRAKKRSTPSWRLDARTATKNFFFDYNTVESVLLACGVLVCLSGLMFESGYLDTGSASARESKVFVTVAVLTTIFASIVYFLVVFGFEVAVEFGSKGCCGLKWSSTARADSKQSGGELPANKNPMFKSPRSQPVDTAVAAVEIAQADAVPDHSRWQVFREEFASQRAEIISLKEQMQRQDAVRSPTARPANAATKTSFAQVEKNGQKPLKHASSALYKSSNKNLSLGARGSNRKQQSSPAVVSEQERRKQEAALGIMNMGATDAAGKPLASGWLRKQMGDKTWYENDILGKKAWSPIY